MSEWSDRFSRDLYNGLWRWLVPLLRVPEDPPDLPRGNRDELYTFRPAPGFLRYLRMWFWILAISIDIAILVGWIIIAVINWIAGLALFPIVAMLMFVPDILAFVAIHLRYDTTWYAMTNRAIRIRRGIWVIRETTISFENVQNVNVRQGPIERLFGIANVTIETAGSGSSTDSGSGASWISNKGVIEGVDNAPEIRDRILRQVRASQSTGLGDEENARSAPTPGIHLANTRCRSALAQEHTDTLREIRNLLLAQRGIAPASDDEQSAEAELE